MYNYAHFNPDIARSNQAKENRELNFEEENMSGKNDSVDYEDFGLVGSSGGGGGTGANGKVNLFP